MIACGDAGESSRKLPHYPAVTPPCSLPCGRILEGLVFLRHRPSADEMRRHLERQARLPFSYAPIGGTRGDPPRGYTVDHNRAVLGTGAGTLRRAASAIRRWEMFHLGWVEVFPPDAPVRPGTTVGVPVHLPGLWSLNFCRIAY